jgi:hypothetical protein
VDPRHKRVGDHGMGYPCQGCSGLSYNAVLYFRLEHLTLQNGTKDHRERVGADWFQDASGCHEARTANYPCPQDDDSREGNSHPYNPDLPFPIVRYDGTRNHGGSGACRGAPDCHEQFEIDIYYGYLAPPPVRAFWLVDAVGAEAPYHCHPDHRACDMEDLAG